MFERGNIDVVIYTLLGILALVLVVVSGYVIVTDGGVKREEATVSP